MPETAIESQQIEPQQTESPKPYSPDLRKGNQVVASLERAILGRNISQYGYSPVQASHVLLEGNRATLRLKSRTKRFAIEFLDDSIKSDEHQVPLRTIGARKADGNYICEVELARGVPVFHIKTGFHETTRIITQGPREHDPKWQESELVEPDKVSVHLGYRTSFGVWHGLSPNLFSRLSRLSLEAYSSERKCVELQFNWPISDRGCNREQESALVNIGSFSQTEKERQGVNEFIETLRRAQLIHKETSDKADRNGPREVTRLFLTQPLSADYIAAIEGKMRSSPDIRFGKVELSFNGELPLADFRVIPSEYDLFLRPLDSQRPLVHVPDIGHVLYFSPTTTLIYSDSMQRAAQIGRVIDDYKSTFAIDDGVGVNNFHDLSGNEVKFNSGV